MLVLFRSQRPSVASCSATPNVPNCHRALQHQSSCPSSALRASRKREGQPRTWVAVLAKVCSDIGEDRNWHMVQMLLSRLSPSTWPTVHRLSKLTLEPLLLSDFGEAIPNLSMFASRENYQKPLSFLYCKFSTRHANKEA